MSHTPGASTRTGARPAPAAGPAVTPAVDPAWRPALSPGIMLRRDRVREADLLVLPERVVVLTGRAVDIVRRCDGRREVAAIVGELAERFPGAPVPDEVPAFLARLREQGWLR
ncbi:pyrroloquinoline quinone biosynthesis peptide chaperone PqqD [Streptomyces buecherae]|nr:pyrroloquinoline quinone biosynthesis peptide chaperone PqqD [Streptomyces buecherae]